MIFTTVFSTSLWYNFGMYSGSGDTLNQIKRHIDACDYLTVAQLFLKSNFLLETPLSFDDIKPRLLGHWGTCHGINLAYANLKYFYEKNPGYSFVLGPGHGFPALQANLFVDGELEKVDKNATRNLHGIEYLCKNFSWPGGFPSHASPMTPNVICEGGELGYALATAFGAALGHPEKTIAVLIGDGELETATALSSLNMVKLAGGKANGKVIPILHLNGYKISAPTIYGRSSERELMQMFRGFGFEPVMIDGTNDDEFQQVLGKANRKTFIIMQTPKGYSGPKQLNGVKIEGNCAAHQVPLPEAKTDAYQRKMLEEWLKSYNFEELYNEFIAE